MLKKLYPPVETKKKAIKGGEEAAEDGKTIPGKEENTAF